MLLGRDGAWLLLIMKLGPRPDAMEPDAMEPDAMEPDAMEPDAMEPDIDGVRTQWIRGFMAFGLARRTRTVRLMVSA